VAEPDRPEGQQPAISDYGFLSDCHSAALVDRSGSVDWWCVPRFDSPSVLGRLLDPAAGHWTLRPVGEFTCQRRYVGETLVLRTVFHTDTGTVSVTDALLLEGGARGHDLGLRSPHVLLRRVEGQQGTVRMRTDLSPRMEYGRTEPHLRSTPEGAQARGGPVTLTLNTDVPLSVEDGAVLGEFAVAEGEVVELRSRTRRRSARRLTGRVPRPCPTLWTRGRHGRPSTPVTTATTPSRYGAVRWCCRV
jgi:GH15 family glucan-1,4-alpha-glucosidase